MADMHDVYRLDELVVQDASLKLREQLLEQEKNFIASQNQWLSEELKQKSDELLQLKKERASLVTSVESATTVRDEEVRQPIKRAFSLPVPWLMPSPPQSHGWCLIPSPMVYAFSWLMPSPPQSHG